MSADEPRRAVVVRAGADVAVPGAPARGGSTFEAVFAAAAADCDLPPFPAAAARAMALVNDPDVAIDDVARAVGQDPALAARILRMSCSAMFARHQPPQTLVDAIRLVGLVNVRSLLVAAAARTLYDGRGGVIERLWTHAIATAFAADELAVLAGRPRGGELFLTGLFHDVGKLVFHLAKRTDFATLGWADHARETALFGHTHAVVGGALVFRWQLGRGMAEAIVDHHARPAPAGTAADLTCADWIAHRIGCGSVAVDAVEPPDADLAHLDAVAERVRRRVETERGAFD